MLFKTLLLASTASATCLHGLRRRAEGEEVEIPQFGYEDTFGPLNWASLAPENEACKTGSNQSPINIDSSVSLATEKPVLDIPAQAVKFENLNTTIEVVVEGTTRFAGSEFTLAQFHIHTPSEHRINREYSPLEVHMVHQNVADENQIAVIALMFELCTESSDPIISGITPHLDAITEPGSSTEIEGGLDFSNVISQISESNIFQYTGSLTTPPCTEGVTFLAVETPFKINVPDFNAIKKLVKFNSRVTQNVLGNDNIISVAAASGATANNNQTTATEQTEAAPSSGSKVVVSEISGTPLAAPIEGHVPRGVNWRQIRDDVVGMKFSA